MYSAGLVLGLEACTCGVLPFLELAFSLCLVASFSFKLCLFLLLRSLVMRLSAVADERPRSLVGNFFGQKEKKDEAATDWRCFFFRFLLLSALRSDAVLHQGHAGVSPTCTDVHVQTYACL